MEFKEGQEVLVKDFSKQYISKVKRITSCGSVQILNNKRYSKDGLRGEASQGYETITNDIEEIEEFKNDYRKRRVIIAIKARLNNHSYSLEILETINDMLKHGKE